MREPHNRQAFRSEPAHFWLLGLGFGKRFPYGRITPKRLPLEGRPAKSGLPIELQSLWNAATSCTGRRSPLIVVVVLPQFMVAYC
jgi:hypothetical protein